ncbi:MAG: polyprenyl synthetase family protein [Leptospiraceae bacterium]|nr:polyprenyl synthetase family protein [Leptospiraceae bacterium]MCP5499132.1 polyprenyl synthetase family protein [Leptospiraceae bacterium]
MPSIIQTRILIQKFDKKLDKIIHEDIKLLKDIKKYVVSSGGKRIRPITHYYFTRLLGYEGEEWLDVGAIAELIHSASLLHDDVVDKSDTRRGKPTVGKLYGNKVAILSGDYLLASGIEHLNSLQKPALMDSFTRVIRYLAVGELIQMQWERNPKITPAIYEQIIYGKTASLFGAVCETAGILANSSQKTIEDLRKFGDSMGRLFQVRDDYIDYFTDEKSSGKTFMKDFYNGLYTYPVIVLKEKAKSADKKEIDLLFKKDERDRIDAKRIQELFQVYEIKEILVSEIQSCIEELINYVKEFGDSKLTETIIEKISELKV